MSENIDIAVKVKVDDSELNQSEAKRQKLKVAVADTVAAADKSTDLTWMKAVSTVQHIETIINQALRLAGLSLNKVTEATIAVVGKAAATLIPILTAQEISGWMAVQATLGLISVGIAVANLSELVAESQRTGSFQPIIIQTNNGIGRINTVI